MFARVRACRGGEWVFPAASMNVARSETRLRPEVEQQGKTGNSTTMEWITRLMEALGSPGAGLAVALENVFPPVPSEVILPLAGFTAGQGRSR